MHANDSPSVLITARSMIESSVWIHRLETAIGARVTVHPGPLDSKSLGRAWREADAAIIGLDEADEAAVRSAHRLRVISRFGSGFDNVDLEAARRRGSVVTTTPGVNEESVADLTLALILALARRLPEALLDEPASRRPRNGAELSGKIIGIVGPGRIGAAVARRAIAFGMAVVYAGPNRKPAFEAVFNARRLTVHDLAATASIVTLHCPSTPMSRRMVDATFLAAMRRDGWLVNTARADLVDEEALRHALQDERIAGAALDVWSDHPGIEGAHPLHGLPNVVFTPHIGSLTVEARSRMADMAVDNVIAVLRGTPPPGAVVS